ncbi:MAG: NapC/NirT family cytochrome c [Alphaproteobacteria bacterium]
MTGDQGPERRESWGAGRSPFWQRFYKTVFRFPIVGLVAMFATGVMVWGGFNWSMELTNTETFCISCHTMKQFPYQEYKKTVHYSNRTGVRASCPDCHVPREWVHKVARKVRATNELFHWIKGTINTPEKFGAKRYELAQHVWDGMRETDSRECRNCHAMDSMDPEAQTTRSYLMHGLGEQWDMTCIECHQGIAHTLPKEFDPRAVMDKLHDRMEEDKVECRLCHEEMTGPKPGDGW